MSALAALLEGISSLLWPIVFIVAICMFRRQLMDLLGRIQSIKVGSLEARLRDIGATLERESEPLPSAIRSKRDEARHLLGSDPSRALSDLREFYRGMLIGLTDVKGQRGRDASLRKLAAEAVRQGKIDDWTADAIRIWDLAHIAALAGEIDPKDVLDSGSRIFARVIAGEAQLDATSELSANATVRKSGNQS